MIGALAAGCAQAAPELATTTSAATGPATVTTDATAYAYARPVIVTWSGLNGSATDWIALAPAGSPLTTATRWAYVASASGSRALEGPVPGGSYVARAFDADSYTLMGESDPFTVASATDTAATVAFSAGPYAIDQAITVSWTGLPGSPSDWVSIAPPGSADSVTPTWLYTGGAANGSITFPVGLAYASWLGFPGGNYVARLYLNGTYTRAAESSPVLIGSVVTTSAATYPAASPITVSWTHLPGGPDDWIGLAPAGANPEVVTAWLYAGGAVDGSKVFTGGLATAGSYVARTFTPNSYFISGQSAPFTVTTGGGSTLTTNQASYALGEPITVTWTGLTTNAHDWIAIAPAGSSDTTVTRWVYTGGAAAGSFAFEGPGTAATYVARAFFNDTYTKVGQSASFTVN